MPICLTANATTIEGGWCDSCVEKRKTNTMEKKNKGLVDDHEDGIILNESGTTVSFDPGSGAQENVDQNSLSERSVEDTGADKKEPGRAEQR